MVYPVKNFLSLLWTIVFSPFDRTFDTYILFSISFTFRSFLSGFSVDYVVHMGHMYIEAAEKSGAMTREKRFFYAASKMGSTVMAGAITTAGSGAFMFLCQMMFFYKMAVRCFFLYILLFFLIFTIILCFLCILTFFEFFLVYIFFYFKTKKHIGTYNLNDRF